MNDGESYIFQTILSELPIIHSASGMVQLSGSWECDATFQSRAAISKHAIAKRSYFERYFAKLLWIV